MKRWKSKRTQQERHGERKMMSQHAITPPAPWGLPTPKPEGSLTHSLFHVNLTARTHTHKHTHARDTTYTQTQLLQGALLAPLAAGQGRPQCSPRGGKGGRVCRASSRRSRSGAHNVWPSAQCAAEPHGPAASSLQPPGLGHRPRLTELPLTSKQALVRQTAACLPPACRTCTPR